MCNECGCGVPAGAENHPTHSHPHDLDHSHPPVPGHPEAHDHPHDHPADRLEAAARSLTEERRTLVVRQAILDKNDRLAERNRGFFQARGLLVLNVLSSPGSGKTTLIQKTIQSLQGRLKTGVIVGDLATDNDARRLRTTGAPVVQINTGTMCHLDAEMVTRSLRQIDLDGLGLLIIENVGNLVCPAAYDLGETLRVVLLSVTEGEDKPLKYPPVFQSADVAILSKMDLATACNYQREAALANIRQVGSHARIFELSAQTGQGLEPWCEFVIQQAKL